MNSALNSDATEIADRFLSARRNAEGLSGYPGQMPLSLDGAYAVQDAAIAAWNRPVCGWKVGRVPPHLVDQFGADRLAGPIFSSHNAAADDGSISMPVFDKGFAAAESEFLLRIGKAPTGQTSFTLEETANHIDAVHVGIEIASSPLGAINDLGPVAIISDFGNNNGVVVGPAIADWRDSRFESWRVTTLIDGEEVGTGTASAFPNGAIGSARFLFELMAKRGIALRPGQWISTGAVTGVHKAGSGQQVEANFEERFSVRCQLTAAKPE